MVQLSNRLKALADMVSPGLIVADVGCDHGFVSIYLVQKKIAPKVYAMDVRKGPLDRAKEHIMLYGLKEQIETKLSDGLTALKPGEANAMVCAGMGGPLMMKILTEGEQVISQMEELILQPQSEIEEFRRFIRTLSFSIVEEKMILEEGKFYPMMRLRKVEGELINMPREACQSMDDFLSDVSKEGAQNMLEKVDECTKRRLENKFGPLLLTSKDETLLKYLQFQLHICEEILEKLKAGNNEKIEEKRVEILAEMKDIQLAMQLM